MILRQFLHTDPVAISYLFGCGGNAACAVVDPLGDIEPYLRVADGMNIRFVVDTHVHADHRSAGRPLASAAGAEYVLQASAEVAFPIHAVKDGDRLAEEPWFVLTGHTLMVGDVGRTELAENAAMGARTLFTSLQRLKALPDYIEVLPGAYSGSVCGRRLSGKPYSTIGFERRHNAAFKIEAEAEFAEFMLQDIPPVPVGAAEIRAWNTGSRAVAAE